MARKKRTARKTSAPPAVCAAERPPLPSAEPEPAPRLPYPIVGFGASAGGFEAFRELLRALPADTGMAFVLVQHLDPDHESMLTKLLSKATSLPVTEVKEGMGIEPNHVYVIPPNASMEIRNGALHLLARGQPGDRHMPIDYFLRSLAKEQGSRAIGVILSGTASDGTLGLMAVKAEGGITFAQDEKSAKYEGMPHSAVSAGCVDFVLPPAGIAHELARIGRHPYLGLAPLAKAPEREGEDHLRRVMGLLRSATGVDFTYYKPGTIRRRISRRMVLHKIEDLKQYVKFLQGNRAELEALYNDILIHVTNFFREPESFQALKSDVFPKIISRKAPREAIRIWVPGCSTGEEVYSLAICLLEHLGERASVTPIQIFGTDIGEPAIEKARAGVYSDSALADVPPAGLRRFFTKINGGQQITKRVREMCVFARQDLAKDPPFSRLDLISCRNVLIYMGPLLQKQVLSAFHYALKPSGFLLLGRSESISGYSELFASVDRKNKIYCRRNVQRPVTPDSAADTSEKLSSAGRTLEPVQPRFDVQKEADRITLRRFAPAGFLTNENLQIIQFRGQTGPYLEPLPGEASLSLLKMIRSDLLLELRTAVHQAKKQESPVRKEGIQREYDGRSIALNLEVIPIADPRADGRYFLVLFEEHRPPEAPQSPAAARKGKPKREEPEYDKLKQDLETTREYLQSIIEEQEATNEELKSANEEVMSSNEELQSTNEELETAKEELQSSNEELVTVNDTLQSRNAELGQTSDDLSNLLTSLNIPIVMLDNSRFIRRFTPMAEKLLNLLPADVGRPIGNLRPNIDVPDLETLIGEAIDTVSLREREVQDQEGRWYLMRIRPYRTAENKIDGVVLMLVDIDALKRSRDELKAEHDFVSAVLDTTLSFLVVLDSAGRIVHINPAYEQAIGYTLEELRGKLPWEVLALPEGSVAFEQLYRDRFPVHYEGFCVGKDGRRRKTIWFWAVLPAADGSIKYVIASGVDITDRQQAEDALRESEAALRASQEQLRRVMDRVVTSAEEDRRQISRELHDDLNQKLAMLAVEAAELAQKPPGSREALRSKLRSLEGRAGGLCDDVRRIVDHLHPNAIEHLGLAAALKSCCADFWKHEGIKVRFTHRRAPASLPPNIALCLYRVTQEALRNVARHSGVKRAWVALSRKNHALQLSISDPGAGFDPAANRTRGLGLTSMEERVRLVGGTISIQSESGAGTQLIIEVPLPRQVRYRNSKQP